ncbi:F-box/kelch-repeat protein At3g06240-like [Lotus japonicus]|uniref:F-box/kelch-repeat protein At3g06240-like n=1 Tax=Lotus japonicus TaxID=34305 RepID=UPI002587D04F|nr:F-box/kelch-repeat protein At3g06240-like [Lotus japonicus]
MACKELPEELVVMILVRLPVKSVVRFRCISKGYNALTRGASFVTEHLSHSIAKAKSKSNFLVFHQINKFFISQVSEDEQSSQPTLVDLKPPFIYLENENNIIVHAHSNGIIYLELMGVPRNPNPKILWNPATREVKFLPLPPPTKHVHCNYFHMAHGFGVDPRTNDYKVVNIVVGAEFLLKEDERLSGQVYNLRSDSWKVVNVSVLARYIAKSMFNSYLNGAYHWLAESGEVEFVLCFDMSDDVFWKMNLPQVTPEEKKKFYIRHSNVVVLNERVGYVREYMRSEIRFEIWMMNEYDVEESWVRMFHLLRGPCPENIVEFWKDDGDVEVLGGEEYQPLVLYKIGEQRIMKEFSIRLGIEHRAFRYVESVVRLSDLVNEEA